MFVVFYIRILFAGMLFLVIFYCLTLTSFDLVFGILLSALRSAGSVNYSGSYFQNQILNDFESPLVLFVVQIFLFFKFLQLTSGH